MPTLDLPHVVIILALLGGSAVLGVLNVFSGGAVLSVFIAVAASIGISVTGKAAARVFDVGRQAGSARHLPTD